MDFRKASGERGVEGSQEEATLVREIDGGNFFSRNKT